MYSSFWKKKILFKSYNREKVKLEGHLAWEHLGKLSFVREIKSIKWFGLRINVKPLSVQVMKPKLVARVLWHFQISVFNTSTEKRQPFQCWKWPLLSKPIRKDYNIVGAEPITGIRFYRNEYNYKGLVKMNGQNEKKTGLMTRQSSLRFEGCQK